MIKVVFNGRSRSYTGIDAMVKALNVEPLDEETAGVIKKANRKGDSVYANLCPYAAELECRRVLVARDTAENLELALDALRDEI